MTLQELLRDYERRRLDAERFGTSAPLAKVFGEILHDLRTVDGIGNAEVLMTTDEAATALKVARKTVAKWCVAGRFPNAHKTSEAGEWRIPSSDVYVVLGKRRATIPRLWEKDDGEAA